ncbi:MAG: hypothetical protein O3A47_12255 [Chloroflexi bacterium]|nr:hypothetical protein [Chloroflexota bacterium]
MGGAFGVGVGGGCPGGAVVGRMLAGGVLALALIVPGRAPAGTWDELLSNSHWYVPEENLLAYMATSGSSFTSPPPLVLWDQTLWALGPAVNGLFSGSSQATFYVTPQSSFSQTTTVQGIATEEGQIRMKFTPTSGGDPIIGIGQFRSVSGTTAMQMQMISGPSGGPYITHWAYMLPYDPATFTPPDPLPNEDLTSTEWAWTAGSRWDFQSDSLFGLGGEGQFTITDYRNGYFWGSGTGPAGSPYESFTQLGSITPEGNVLFNILNASGSLVSLAGLVAGGAETGRMELREYEFSGDEPAFGPLGVAVVVPEPGALGLAAVAALALSLRFNRRHAVRNH